MESNEYLISYTIGYTAFLILSMVGWHFLILIIPQSPILDQTEYSSYSLINQEQGEIDINNELNRHLRLDEQILEIYREKTNTDYRKRI